MKVDSIQRSVVKDLRRARQTETHTRRKRPRRHNSRAFSSVSHKFSSTNLRSHLLSAASYAEMSPVRMAAVKGA